MKPPVSMWGLAAALVLFGQVVAAATSYNPEQCPHTPECVCKWISGKRVADCTDAGLTEIPRTLKPDIQTLIMDGNPLTRLHKNAFKSVNLLNIQKLSMRGCGYAPDAFTTTVCHLMHFDIFSAWKKLTTALSATSKF